MKNRISRTSPLIKKSGLKSARIFVGLAASGGILFGSAAGAFAQDAPTLEKENQDLKARVDALEQIAQKAGLIPSGTPAPKLVSAMTDISISGFVQTSYFYNTRRPADGESDGYLWNTKDNSFSLNKFKLTVASKPVATDKWDAGFRASLLFGDDAPDLNSPGINGNNGTNAPVSNTSFNDLREAYVELNVPIGTGLDIKAGELISLLNWESGDGGAANPNFSQGNQWWFTGNGPSAGIQLGYNFTDKIGLTVRVDNGLFQGPVDNNSGKAFSGSIALKPTKDLWVNLIGWYDSEPGTTAVAGGSVIGGDQVTGKLGTGFEVDYFNFSNVGNSSDLWSVGGWVWYDFTAKVDLALRADYVDSPDAAFGLGPAVRPGAGITTQGGSYLGSVTLTLNLKPTPNIKIQPEIRYDYTSFSGGLDGKQDRVIIGCGASYLF
jgi:hypothetical protein